MHGLNLLLGKLIGSPPQQAQQADRIAGHAQGQYDHASRATAVTASEWVEHLFEIASAALHRLTCAKSLLHHARHLDVGARQQRTVAASMNYVFDDEVFPVELSNERSFGLGHRNRTREEVVKQCLELGFARHLLADFERHTKTSLVALRRLFLVDRVLEEP